MSSSSSSTAKPLHSFQPYEGAEGELFPNPEELTIDDDVMVAKELVGLSDTKPSVGERKLRWNLRDRSSLQKAANPNMVGGSSSNNVLEKGKQRIETAPKNEEALPKLPKFTIELKPQEISDDIFAMTGKTIPKKAKKKAKSRQNWIHPIFPGRSLETRRINHYKVFEDDEEED